MSSYPSGTVTFLFTDIEDSTRLWQEQPEAMSHVHALHDQILHEATNANRGYVFQVVGDSFSVAFHNAQDALMATLTAQRELQTRQKDSAHEQFISRLSSILPEAEFKALWVDGRAMTMEQAIKYTLE